MRKIIAAVVTSLALSGLVVATPAASHAAASDSARAGSHCVTKKEYRRVHKGTTMKRVHRIFDTRGKVTSSGFGFQDREYKPCSNRRWGFVDVSYERKRGAMRAWFKYAYWG